MTTLLQKYYGSNIDALFCDKCITFQVIMMGKDNTEECPTCNTKREVCAILVGKTSNTYIRSETE